MSTPATYQIASDSFAHEKNYVCYYIHYDGDPSGAAEYFLAMHNYKNKRGGFAEQFFRANENAQFIDGHDTNYNTVYRYNLQKDGTLIVYQATYHIRKRWQLFYTGLWHDFVNVFLQLEGDARLYKFTTDAHFNLSSAMTIGSAKEYLEELNKKIKEGYNKEKRDFDYISFLSESAELLSEQIEKVSK